MKDSTGVEWYTIAQAALAVDRKRRTIERWLDNGMPSQRVRGVRYISERDLFARLRLILATEPEVKTRHERPAGKIAVPALPPREGAHAQVIDVAGNIVREGEIYDWSDVERIAEPTFGSHPAAIVQCTSRLAILRLWFVDDASPTSLRFPDDFHEIRVTRRSEDGESDDAPV